MGLFETMGEAINPNKNIIFKEPTKECYLCGSGNIQAECEICNESYCDKCSAKHTQHNNIDYNCCEQCGETGGNKER